jgi:hypothetical protein
MHIEAAGIDEHNGHSLRASRNPKEGAPESETT